MDILKSKRIIKLKELAKELRELRAMAKKETTYFSSSAEPVEDDIYVWDN